MQKSSKKKATKKWNFSNFQHQSIPFNQQKSLKGGSDIITEDDVNN